MAHKRQSRTDSGLGFNALERLKLFPLDSKAKGGGEGVKRLQRAMNVVLGLLASATDGSQPYCPVRCRAGREQLQKKKIRLKNISGQNQNLALTVLCVTNLFDSGRNIRPTIKQGTERAARGGVGGLEL